MLCKQNNTLRKPSFRSVLAFMKRCGVSVPLTRRFESSNRAGLSASVLLMSRTFQTRCCLNLQMTQPLEMSSQATNTLLHKLGHWLFHLLRRCTLLMSSSKQLLTILLFKGIFKRLVYRDIQHLRMPSHAPRNKGQTR